MPVNRHPSEDRICSRTGCITILCSYNLGAECFVHREQRQDREVEREQAMYRHSMHLIPNNTIGRPLPPGVMLWT